MGASAPPSKPPRLATWTDWLHRMNPEITWLLESMFVYKAVGDLLTTNPRVSASPDLFGRWYSYHYAHSASSGVRRMIDRDARSISLVRLLSDIRKHRTSITRAWHLSMYPPDRNNQHTADLTFSNIAGAGQPSLPAQVVQADLKLLEACRTAMGQYVDKRVAHHDGQTHVAPPRYKDLHDAIGTLDRVWTRYNTLLRAEGLST